MVSVVAILGQSNACQLWPHLAAELEVLGKSVNIIDGSAGGTALLQKCAEHKNEYWLNEDKGSPLSDALNRIGVAKPQIRVVWWVQGENEALFGPVTEDEYTDGLVRLRAILLREFQRDSIEFVVSPIAGSAAIYPHARPVLAAQYKCERHGFRLGPEYYDLMTDEKAVHMSEEQRIAFAKRGAAIIAPFL